NAKERLALVRAVGARDRDAFGCRALIERVRAPVRLLFANDGDLVVRAGNPQRDGTQGWLWQLRSREGGGNGFPEAVLRITVRLKRGAFISSSSHECKRCRQQCDEFVFHVVSLLVKCGFKWTMIRCRLVSCGCEQSEMVE